MDFATQLIDFRRQANMTISRLSELSGVPTSTISNYEHGVMPTLDKVDKLMKALGMSLVIGKGHSARDEWISVEDRLPDESDYYIVRITNGNVTSFWYSEENGWRTDKKDQITHWILFPKFPKEEL